LLNSVLHYSIQLERLLVYKLVQRRPNWKVFLSKRSNRLSDQVSATNTSLISHSCSQPITPMADRIFICPGLPSTPGYQAGPSLDQICLLADSPVHPCEEFHSCNRQCHFQSKLLSPYPKSNKKIPRSFLGPLRISTRENPCGRSSTAIHETYEAHIRECGVTQVWSLQPPPILAHL
jgi:hypothetical protein